MRIKIQAFLELMRPANVITALTDVLAGMAIVEKFSLVDYYFWPILTLGLSSMFIYAGAVVFNDIFDHQLDQIERPERALPSGRISPKTATIGGIFLLVSGMAFAFIQGPLSGIIAVLITILALFYDYKGKHMRFFGPINMGLCRAFNLLLGMSCGWEFDILANFYLIIIPLIYIAAITMVSRGEVHGSRPITLWVAALLFILVHASQLAVGFQTGKYLYMLPFVLVHAYLIFTKLSIAIKNPIGPNIGQTVKTGVLTLILMNAAWVALSEQYFMAFVTLALLPISMWVGKKFAVS